MAISYPTDSSDLKYLHVHYTDFCKIGCFAYFPLPMGPWGGMVINFTIYIPLIKKW